MLAFLILSATGLNVLFAVGLIVRILLQQDLSSSARLAWTVVIVAIPIVGCVLYIFAGEIRISDELRRRHKKAFAKLRAGKPEVFCSNETAQDLPDNWLQTFRLGQSINGFPPVDGNRAKLFVDAESTHKQLIADIDGARESVNLLFYIWLTDTTGTDIATALMRAAHRGVTCRAAADNLGSRELIKSPLWAQMKETGVRLQIAMPLRRRLSLLPGLRMDLRNHRKLIIVDGAVSYVGSKNAADPEFLPKAKFGPWIDIMLRVEGPVVNQVQALFASDWMLQDDAAPTDFLFSATPVDQGFVAQFRGTGPLERRGSVSQVFCSLFEQAREELMITTPYFVPDIPVLHAMQAAALRGVDVTLTLPRRNDSWIVKAASRGCYPGLLRAGVRIFEHGPGLLHSKIITADQQIALLGSCNLDLRSFDLNFENDLLIHDPFSTGQIRERQMSYVSQACQVTLDEIENRSVAGKLWDNVIATLGPVL